MDKESLIKDILFVGKNWESRREKAKQKIANLLPAFPACSICGNAHAGANLFWVIEEETTGLLVKKTRYDVFSVCSLKCLFDHGLKQKAYYSVVARLANGKVLATGFQGRNAVAINEFALDIAKA
ncbi:hypothetical protein [Desulfotomaculum nigrificans]|uniref:hypothetical protein n=1 Tax=Desulfotomaculum nigrificans TaxID=1565 RepID=UPI0001FAE967|nr:hypothetical protein [Desulfotomaculum nigrificans]